MVIDFRTITSVLWLEFQRGKRFCRNALPLSIRIGEERRQEEELMN